MDGILKFDYRKSRVAGRRGFREALARDVSGGGNQDRPEVVYYFANGTLANGAVLESGPNSPPQESEAQYVNFASAPTADSSVLLENVDGGLGGLTPIKISYAYDGNTGDRPGKLDVNGTIIDLTATSTGAFGVWQDFELTVDMLAGPNNDFKVSSTTLDFANIHALRVYPNTVPAPPPPPPPPAPPPPAPSPTPPPAPAPGAPQQFQAEDMTLSGGVVIESSNGVNHSGSGYANFPLTGGKIEKTGVHGGTGGDWACDIRYALGNAGFREAVFKINGAPTTVRFESTGTGGSWDNYVVIRIYGTGATSGATNTISIESNGQDCGNIDWLYFIPNTSAPPVVTDDPYEIQAEDMELSGGAVVETGNGPGYTGLGYVNYLPDGSMSRKRNCNGGIAGGPARVDVYYAYDGNTGTRTGKFGCNAAEQDLVTPATGGPGEWGNYLVLSLYITMTAGFTNDLLIRTIGQDLANIDKIKVFPNTAAPPSPAPPPPAPPPPSPAPPPPPPTPAGSVDAVDIFAAIDIAAQTWAAGVKGGAGGEWDTNLKTGLAGISNTVGQGCLAGNNFATGPLGRVRIGKKLAPENDGRYVMAIRGHKDDGLTAGAPRTEVSWWITTTGIIPIKQDFWFAFGVYLSEGFPITNEACIAQWHTNGNTSAGYAGQPFFAIYLKGGNIQVQQRWNANAVLSQGTTQSRVYTKAGITPGVFNYFVVKARISPKTNDNPYLQMWRAVGPSGILVSEINSLVDSPGTALGYTGFDNGDPPWQKMGHYPYGHITFNVWNAPLTRELLYRCPIYVDDPTSKYLPVDMLNHVRTR